MRPSLPDDLPPPLAELAQGAFARLEEAGVPLAEALARPDGAAIGDGLVRLVIGSDWAVDRLTRHPQELTALLDAELHRHAPERDSLEAELAERIEALALSDGDLAEPDGPLGTALRDFRNLHQLGIVWRDLAGVADLAETVIVLSDLADVTLQAALSLLHAAACRQWGTPCDADGEPQQLVVLALGKLGARELNLSSDIDLMFAYPRPGTARDEAGRELTAQEFFLRLGRRLIGLIDTRTARGFVFRVDMRLRPFGESGPLVQHFDALLGYYEEQGREWERYALIKARTVAGDVATGERLMEGLRPFVYRRYLDFGAIESLREMKRLIRAEVRRRRLHANVKLGEGGIREVEFVAQVFQLIHGGRDIRFQVRPLRTVLQRLGEAGFLQPDEVRQLDAAYVFLRDTEHRLQALRDDQTQQLPTDATSRQRLAWSMGTPDWETFEQRLAGHRDAVSALFGDLIRPAEEDTPDEPDALAPWQELWGDPSGDDADLAFLGEAGFEEPAAALDRLADLRRRRDHEVSQQVGRARLDAVVPRLLALAAASRRPDVALARSLPLVEAVLRRTAYLVLLVENPPALEQLVRLCLASAWVAELVARHPILLDELLDVRHLYTAPDPASIRIELAEHLRGVAEDDLEQQMEQLRYFKEATELRVAACEVGSILPIMKVSDALTWLAEAIIERVVSMAWSQTAAQYGLPRDAAGTVLHDGFAVVAYGKFGGFELGWGSDLDLVFLHDLPSGGTTDGEREVANGQFVARMGQRLIHLLTTRTHTGALYEVDLRLRPAGRSGLLVSSLEAFEAYQDEDAWTWEHQALVRARAVVGPERLTAGFEAVRRRILGRTRARAALFADVVKMRDRMLAELRRIRERPPAEALRGRDRLDLKQDPGGVVDIEFMVQYLVLGWASEQPDLLTYTDGIRTLETAREVGLLAADVADFLIESYKEFRAESHRKALENLPARTDRPELIERADRVAAVWDELMRAPDEDESAAPPGR